MRHAEHGIQRRNLHLRQRLFLRLPGRRLFRRLADLHKSGRKRPEPQPRFDRAPAQQNLPLPLGNTASDNFGIMVMNSVTMVAHIAQHIVAGWDLLTDRGPAGTAEFHGRLFLIR